MQREEFNALGKQGFNRIPLVKEVLADLETPLSLYVKLTQAFGKTNTYLLESVLGGERFGRFSFIGLPAKTILKTIGTPSAPVNEVIRDGKVVESNTDNPLDFVDAYFKRFRVALPPGLPRFCGGLAGYFGYDTVRYIEARLAKHSLPDELGMPDIQLMLTEELAVIDNVAGKIYLIAYADPSQPESFDSTHERLKELLACLSKPVSIPASLPSKKTELIRKFKVEDFENAVRRTKEYILAGDCMQVVIGQRISKPFTDSPLALYRALRSLNPSPYMYF
ncbi:MAG: chorismate-binding protein, partial [Betaproteobacteria bacterium]|nr:chorismate-binding protein [Betaproteobacteria bacterium]